MKQFAKRISALVLVFVLSLAALAPAAFAAASLPTLPSGQCVVDDAGVLSSSTVQAITDLNAQLESSCNGAQIGVLTVDYTGNYSTEDYATEAFNTWGIGSASENNGVLILLVMESPLYDDGDYYVTYGDGFRNTTLESQASAIAQTMEDDFVRKDYDSAVVTCANNVAETIADIYGVSLSGGSYNDGYYDGGYAEPVDEPTTFGDVGHRDAVHHPAAPAHHRDGGAAHLRGTHRLCNGLPARVLCLGCTALSPAAPAAASGPRPWHGRPAPAAQ